MSDFFKNISSGLNEKQLEAVVTKGKNTLVLAGAGSGKTKVLTSRISYLNYRGVDFSSIFAATFTNKAAREMKDRIKLMVGEETNIDDMWIGTFHSLCNKILREHHSLISFPKNYQVIDSEDQKTLIKRSIEELEKEGKIYIDDKREFLKDSVNFINKSKENSLRPQKSIDYATYMGLSLDHIEVYGRYEKLRKSSFVMDFQDLILYVVEIFENDEGIRKYYSQKFHHVLVDEYQDTNDIQHKFVSYISNGGYKFFVGDEDQSIYGWRGAKIENIIKFGQRTDEVEVIRLEQNYRSTKNILAAANSVIKGNKVRLGKNLWSENSEGEKITLIESYSPDEEALIIAKEVRTLLNRYRPSDIAILYRNNAISRAFESKLTEAKIPYKLIGGVSFWERTEVKDVLAYLDIILNKNNDVSFERVINKPSRKVGKKTLEKIREYSSLNNKSLFNSLVDMLAKKEIKGKSAEELNNFICFFDTVKKEDIENHINIIISKIVSDIKIMETYSKESEEVRDTRYANINELIAFSSSFINEDKDVSLLDSFLQHAKLQSDITKDKDADCVSMLTIHSSKGLEYPVVFIAGFEESVFPSVRSAATSKSLEEERRLAYVGITRAEQLLYLSFSGTRYGQTVSPSRFLKEVPIHLMISKSNNSYGLSPLSNQVRSYNIKNNQTIKSEFNIGDQYYHDDFGDGEILEVSEKSGKIQLKVNFDFVGNKYIIMG